MRLSFVLTPAVLAMQVSAAVVERAAPRNEDVEAHDKRLLKRDDDFICSAWDDPYAPKPWSEKALNKTIQLLRDGGDPDQLLGAIYVTRDISCYEGARIDMGLWRGDNGKNKTRILRKRSEWADHAAKGLECCEDGLCRNSFNYAVEDVQLRTYFYNTTGVSGTVCDEW